MDIITTPLGMLMRLCYGIISSYGAAIVLFTLLTKIILFPLSLWTQKNSAKLIKLQPAINRAKINYFGNKEKISDTQFELYKTEGYNPFVGLVPTFVQLFLLVCLIRIIYAPLTHVLSIGAADIGTLISQFTASGAQNSSSVQLAIVSAVQDGSFIPSVSDRIVVAISAMDMDFLGFNLAGIPMQKGGIMYAVPLLAGLSSLALCMVQNRINPVQQQQNTAGKIGTSAFSVGLSLVLGGFVPAGVGWYWICSNVMSILQQFLLNAIINPKKIIDIKELEKTREELAKLESSGKMNSPRFGDELYKREKADYKRFFSVANKHIVFYSESNGFYKYFESLIEYLLSHSNAVIHYVTSDPNDNIFKLARSNERICAYYFGDRRLMSVFMKMDADIVIMTMPDIDNYVFKRSLARKDIEYIYMFHYPLSTHMVLPAAALDNYDTVFCVGEFQFDEIRRREQLYSLKEKNLVLCGYGQLEKLQKSFDSMEKTENAKPKVLIAPSWQEDNILDSCIHPLLDKLLGRGYNVVVRPHPEYMKRYKARMDSIIEKYKDYSGGDLTFELDFTSNSSIYNSDVVISDWSGTAYEFSFVTLRPSIFIDTAPKINNPEYEKLNIEPLELTLRDKIGRRFSPDCLDGVADTIDGFIGNAEQYAKEIEALRGKYIANYMTSARVGGRYIIGQLVARAKNNK